MTTDYYIYRHIRKDNNSVFYVGLGRKNRYLSKSGRNKYWKNITNKTEWYSEIIIENLSKKLVAKKEIEFIKLYKSQGMCEANLSSGGEGGFSGLTGYWKNKKFTKQTRKKLSISIKKAWLSGKLNNRKHHKKVKCIQTNKVFNTLTDAAKKMNLNRSAIGMVCRGKRNHTGGYTFKFIKDLNDDN